MESSSGPSWMQQGSATSMMGHSQIDPGMAGAHGPPHTQTTESTNSVRFFFRVAALILGCLMIVSSFIELISFPSLTRFSIAIYNILFATVLILYESQGFVTCDSVDSNMRRYFGLVYGHMGRSFFIIFIAFLNFALTDAGWWGTITGLLLLALGAIMVLVYLQYPHLLDEEPGLGDLKTPSTGPSAATRQGYAPPPTMPSTTL